jgi:hypothetical protein
VTTSTWQGIGQVITLRGSAASMGIMDGRTVAWLTNGTTFTSNAFDFRGRLQDYGLVLVKFSIRFTGSADAIYFYFGGTRVPEHEVDTSNSTACIISLSLFSNQILARMNDPPLNLNFNYDLQSQVGTWSPVEISYYRASDTSFSVRATVSGSTVFSNLVTVQNAGTWLTSGSGDHWGIGARTGLNTAVFLFKDIAVATGQVFTIKIIENFEKIIGYCCLLAGATSCRACTAGTYLTTTGREAMLF